MKSPWCVKHRRVKGGSDSADGFIQVSLRSRGPLLAGFRLMGIAASFWVACVVPNPAYERVTPGDADGLPGVGGESDPGGHSGLGGDGGNGTAGTGLVAGMGGQVLEIDAGSSPIDTGLDLWPVVDAAAPMPDVRPSPPPLCSRAVGLPFEDEDQDGVHDRCDNCPSDLNTDQLNQGETNLGRLADGVGDACDPQPGSAGDAVIFFDNFGGTRLDSGWTGNRNATSVSDGDLHFDLATAGSDYNIQRQGVRDVEVVVRFTIKAWAPGSLNRNFWVGVRAATNKDAYACSARKQADDETSLAFFDYAMYGTPAAKVTTPLDLNIPYVMRMRIKGSQLSCELNNVRYNVAGTNGTNTFIQLGARQLSVSVASVVVYELGN